MRLINLPILVRKISRAKWPNESCPLNNISGDAISELRTTNNTISLWRVDSENDLSTAMLALSASTKSGSIEHVNLVWIPEDEILQKNIELQNTPGDTIISDLISLHFDACKITYKSMGDIAFIISKGLIGNTHYKHYSKSEVKKALVIAYKEHRIAEEKCLPELLDKIKKATAQYNKDF